MLTPLFILLGIIAIVALAVVLDRRAKRLRADALRQTAQQLGFAFQREGDLDRLRTLGDLPLFDLGRSREVSNVMSGRGGRDSLVLFDYEYTTGGGKQSHTRRQTIALYPSGARGLPDFELASLVVTAPTGDVDMSGPLKRLAALEGVIHRLTDALGYQDIDFADSPVFSTRYLLRGTHEAAIRAAFTPGARAFFEQQPGWTVEVRSGNVGIYRAGKRPKPHEIAGFVEESKRVLDVLRMAIT